MGHHYGINQSLHQDQRLVMNRAMHHAFDVLQMPVAELSDWLEKEIEQNPLLEISKPHQSLSYLETAVAENLSQQQYLFREICMHFDSEKRRKIAEYIAGSLNEKGFLTLSIEELCSELGVKKALLLKVLHTFQRMEPVGLGTQGVQEALLVQLEEKGLKGSMIYRIVEQHYSDLLHHRLKKITKVFQLSMTELKSLIHSKLRPLTPFPGHFFLSMHNPTTIPDIIIEKEGEIWKIETNEQDLPSFHIHSQYLEMIEHKALMREDIDYIRRHLSAGQWLQCIVNRRKETLEKIMVYILKKQSEFLEGTLQTPLPMTMSEIALALNKSKSTISRAIANKSVACPLGILKLRTFFTQAIQTDEGNISNKKAKDLLVKLIKQEESPLSDETLSKLLKAQGVPCARRTVTKYRKQLKILVATKRNLWKE